MVPQFPINPASGGVNIEAWTESTRQALGMLSVSSPAAPRVVRGVSVPLDIPLDDDLQREVGRRYGDDTDPFSVNAAAPTANPRRREPIRRDSLKRREVLLKGKEGSRRRQKWENDRLMGNPWVEPPSPSDWEIRPTHPVHNVPYLLASMWDERRAQAQTKASAEARKAAQLKANPIAGVPRELRQKLKRSKGAKGLLQDLEEQVRKFVRMWEEKERQLRREGLAGVASEDEEEIVFVGRNGKMKDESGPGTAEAKLQRDKLVFESLVDDHGASFGRWLVHSIAAYYDLRTWSRTTSDDPARREAYVGIRESSLKGAACAVAERSSLPRPLWGMV